MSEINLSNLAVVESKAPLVAKTPDPFAIEVKDLIPKEVDAYGFKTTASMHFAKVQLKNYLKLNPTASNLSLDDLCKITKTQRIRVWMEKYPKFLIWFIDLEHEVLRMDAYRETAIDVVMKVMKSRYREGVLTAKDTLKAAEMMLQITGAFPQKTKETKFSDKTIESMDADQTKSELRKARETMLTVKEKG